MRRLFLFLVGLAGAAGACAQDPIPSDVQAVIDRSFATRGSYRVVTRVELVIDGRRSTDTTVEFRQGAMYRVENSFRRMLINCDTRETATYEIATARIVSREDQSGVCGVALHADPVQSARMLAPVIGPYGRADVFELTGADYVRRYVVTDEGIVIDNEWTPRRADVGFAIRTLSATVTRGPQDPAMFVESSLGRAFTPAP